MNKREEKAAEVLAAGGFFRKMLERNYYGHEKFEMRLLDKERQIVKGVGFAAWLSFEKRGMLRDRGAYYGSACVQEWELIREVEKASA